MNKETLTLWTSILLVSDLSFTHHYSILVIKSHTFISNCPSCCKGWALTQNAADHLVQYLIHSQNTLKDENRFLCKFIHMFLQQSLCFEMNYWFSRIFLNIFWAYQEKKTNEIWESVRWYIHKQFSGEIFGVFLALLLINKIQYFPERMR